jgi:quinol monooxygenase YgiN
MITLAVTYVVRASHETEAEGFLRELIPATRREPDPRTSFLYEQYDDEAALYVPFS